MVKFFKKLIVFGVSCLTILFFLSNVQYWNTEILPMLEHTNNKPSMWFTLDITRVWRSDVLSAIALILIGLSFLTLLLNSISDNIKIGKRSKYDKKSYARLLTKFERRRGTTLIKYARNGETTEVVETGILKQWYRLKTVIAHHVNKYVTHFLLPATKRWNEIKFDDNGNEIIVGGIPVMAMRKYWLIGNFDKVWYLTGDQHSLFVGSTGRGKTFTYVLLMVYSYIYAGESIVVHDPKREIDALTRRALEIAGYKVIVIDFVDPKSSDGWNPLDVAYKEWKKAIDKEMETWEIVTVKNKRTNTEESFYQKNILHPETVKGNQIVPEGMRMVRIPEAEKYKQGYKYSNVSDAVELVMAVSHALTWEEDAKDPFWHMGAGDMFAGGALFAMEEGIDEHVNAKTARYLIELGDDADSSGMPLLKKYLNKYRDVDSESVRKLAIYLNADGNVKPSLKSVFMNKVSLLTANDNIMNMTSNTTFDMEQIFKEKTAIFLKTHDERSTYYPLVTLFLKQLYEVAIKDTRDNPAEQRLDIPMNWIIDEMGLLPEIMDIEALYGAARSRGVRINAFIQSFEQLEDKYEPKIAKIIEDNSTNVIYLGSQTESTRKRFSELSGNELVYSKKKKDFIERPVVTAERLKSFEKGRSLVNTIEWNPFISKLPPFNLYSFYEEPVWDTKPVSKRPAEYFNIQLEWKKRSIEENTGRKKSAEHKGSKEFNILEEGSNNKTISKFISK
ncbi:type IV secretory system conjugative DNA transfer family protein [Erysipelothrix sp. HDW6B]|uniref:type IV secretory system conjugative DNA transfer family protein n=1 Tax=Erysipelothrix sp. HDW6B TaxID=2714929 RepID=UPI00140A3642|nr:type IV secretory system conjugative DNA transfer family protein [Erysipelothrix sp. HDW6B]QIK86357.1 type IV secretory system conjugative DNA transfer family protein [Erysipelothrix sp. HDW6B]